MLYGELWETACYSVWYANTTNARQPDIVSKIWTITMVVLVNLTILYCAISGLKRWINYRKILEEDQRRQENLETTHDLYV